MLDEGTEFGARVARRLREEMIVWLTTVTPSGAPLPRPVGFLWDGADNVSIYSQSGARIRNIARNPKVTLNFDGDGQGGDIVVLSGTAEVDESGPSAGREHGMDRQVRDRLGALGDDGGVVCAALQRNVPVRIRIVAVHGR